MNCKMGNDSCKAVRRNFRVGNDHRRAAIPSYRVKRTNCRAENAPHRAARRSFRVGNCPRRAVRRKIRSRDGSTLSPLSHTDLFRIHNIAQFIVGESVEMGVVGIQFGAESGSPTEGEKCRNVRNKSIHCKITYPISFCSFTFSSSTIFLRIGFIELK